jgi:hypothetical protein
MAQERPGDGIQFEWERVWRERIAAWRASGQTQKSFCQAHGVSASSLSRWKIRLAKRDAAQALQAGAEVCASASAPERCSESLRWTELRWPAVGVDAHPAEPESSGFEIVLPRGWSVRLGPRFETESLRRLLAVLEERSC